MEVFLNGLFLGIAGGLARAANSMLEHGMLEKLKHNECIIHLSSSSEKNWVSDLISNNQLPKNETKNEVKIDFFIYPFWEYTDSATLLFSYTS